MKATLRPEADAELVVAAQWYEDQSAGLGGQFLDELFDAITSIEQHPRRFARTKQRTRREIRRAMLSRFPYAVVYEIREHDCLIVAVAHAHRNPNYWRARLK